MEASAKAESHRLRYFERVTAAADPAQGYEGKVPLTLLRLEYLCRCQLDVQTTYYLARRSQH
jgi:hypothetical protein